MQIRVHSFDLPLRHTFTIARGSIKVQPTMIVELRSEGATGFGEATSNRYYNVNRDTLEAAIEPLRSQIEAYAFDNPQSFYEDIVAQVVDHPFARCALDEAAHDLWGKLQRKPVYRLWGLETVNCPVSNFTIGIDSIDVMIEKLREVPDWPIYKIKLGTKDDLEIIRALREQTSAVFRVDANCGWTADQTIENSHLLSELNVEFIEQPLPADQWDGMQRVFEQSALPVIADESCIVEEDVPRCVGYFHGINIKLMKCGGLIPARRMIKVARERGLRVMVGCMTESTVGISAIAQLLPLLDYVDMDGAALLASDIATGVSVQCGVCNYPIENGSGIQLLSECK